MNNKQKRLQEILDILDNISQNNDHDEEREHIDADNLLIEALKLHKGILTEIAEAYERARHNVGFWYA